MVKEVKKELEVGVMVKVLQEREANKAVLRVVYWDLVVEVEMKDLEVAKVVKEEEVGTLGAC